MREHELPLSMLPSSSGQLALSVDPPRCSTQLSYTTDLSQEELMCYLAAASCDTAGFLHNEPSNVTHLKNFGRDPHHKKTWICPTDMGGLTTVDHNQ